MEPNVEEEDDEEESEEDRIIDSEEDNEGEDNEDQGEVRDRVMKRKARGKKEPKFKRRYLGKCPCENNTTCPSKDTTVAHGNDCCGRILGIEGSDYCGRCTKGSGCQYLDTEINLPCGNAVVRHKNVIYPLRCGKHPLKKFPVSNIESAKNSVPPNLSVKKSHPDINSIDKSLITRLSELERQNAALIKRVVLLEGNYSNY